MERDLKNVWKKVLPVFVAVNSIISIGCATRPIEDSELVRRNAQSITRLEDTVQELDRILGDSTGRIEAVTEQSRNITDGIERVEFLFEQYESETGRLLQEIERLRQKIEEQD